MTNVLANVSLIDEKLSFIVETDASENAISVALYQHNQLVSSLADDVLHVSVEKQALVIVEAVRQWALFSNAGFPNLFTISCHLGTPYCQLVPRLPQKLI